MIKRYRHEEIVKRLDNLKNKLGSYIVDAIIEIYKTWTDNEDDYLHLAFYHLRDAHLKYRQQTFGYRHTLDYEKKKVKLDDLIWCGTNEILCRDYFSIYNSYDTYADYRITGVTTSPIYTVTTATNSIW
jgi:hypothetical protein